MNVTFCQYKWYSTKKCNCNELVAVQARAKRKVVKLVLVVITTFVVCWSPHQVTRQY